MVVGGLWSRKRLFEIAESDGQVCRACCEDIDTDSHPHRNCAELMNMPMDSDMLYLHVLSLEVSSVVFDGHESSRMLFHPPVIREPENHMETFRAYF